MLRNRIVLAQQALKTYNIDAMLIEREEDIAYFLYDEAVSGTLLISQEEAVFFVHKIDKDLYAHIQSVSLIFCSKNHLEVLSNYIQSHAYQSIGFDSEHTSYSNYEMWKKIPCQWEPLRLFTEKLRSIKSEQEIEQMRQAAALGSAGFDYVLSILHEGITEKEVVKQLRTFWAQSGATAPSFPPIVAFGEHAAFPHAIPSNRPLRQGDIVLIDIGVLLDGYCSDMTRTVAWGRPHSRLLESYPIVVEAQKSAMALCREGVLCSDVHEEAVRILRSHGLDEYFFHGTGHGVGRNIHEYPRLSPAGKSISLQSGMTVTVEPGVYFPGLGGIRIEDTLVICGNKNFSITKRPVDSELVCL
ncbi:Xaa-Pro peptidase family protein [Chlamydia sp. 17-3921]|uniref:M24 family metallopeptidase n=1 Tax=Chlamydia sp. 17-3921 TaxID=2675798 RepID=UPI0019180340|nr:Xaa-Pro peptidase family protein [Chlamydia sp. 17-3921]